MGHVSSAQNTESRLQKLEWYRDELRTHINFPKAPDKYIQDLLAHTSDLISKVQSTASEKKRSIYRIMEKIKDSAYQISENAEREEERSIVRKLVTECVHLDRKLLRQHLPKEISVQIRWMIRRDMPEVLDIEHQCFEFPWSDQNFIDFLRKRNGMNLVAEIEDRVVGFIMYELHKDRLHIRNFAVDEQFRRCGIGKSMIEKLKNKLSDQRRTHIALEVRETNVPAQLFFRRMGFRATNVLRDFYEDTTEDAYAMEYTIPGSEEDGGKSFDRVAG